MNKRIIGTNGPSISTLGLGCMGMSDMVNVAQIAIAWVLSRGEDIIPLIGARRLSQLQDALSSLDVQLSSADLTKIEAAIPAESVAGDRYNAYQMAHLDSEQK